MKRFLFLIILLCLTCASVSAQDQANLFRPTATPPNPPCPYSRLFMNLSNQMATVSCTGVVTVIGSGGGGSGTVTSVALSLPAIFTVSGSPITTSGTLSATLASQTANTVFSGPSSGGSAAPTFRALVLADLPASITLTATQVSSNYTALTTDWTISMDTSGGNRTVTLYAASNTGKLLSVCKATTDGNTVTISDGTLSEVIYSPATCMQFLATGSVWKVQSY